jgi:hypothetical protein
VPFADVRGNITSHRARSTIASQLYNAREPMTLFELQEWLGHATPTATQHYAKVTPLKVANSYADAGYFAPNLRAIEVLVDQDVVRSGRAANEPGSSMISAMGTARTISWNSASTAWLAPSSISTYRSNPQQHYCMDGQFNIKLNQASFIFTNAPTS